MSPIPDLAQQLVARMDSVLADLDDLGADRDGLAGPALATVELRQTGGLTAGGSLPLRPGRHEFGPAGRPGTRLEPGEVRAVAFRLTVEPGGEVRIEPGELPVRVDGRRLIGPEPLGDAVIDVAGAVFTVAPTRMAGRRPTGRGPADRERSPLRLPPRPPVPPAGPLHQVARWRRRQALEAMAAQLDRTLADLAAAEARRRRARHPDPEELVHRARTGQDLGAGRADEPGFGLVPVALGDMPWRPPLELDGELEAPLAEVVRARSFLPLVPLQVDLSAGPLAVVGPPAATAAVVRHLVVGLLALNAPGQLRLGLWAPRGSDWSWLDLVRRDDQASTAAPELRIIDAGRVSGDLVDRRTVGSIGPVIVVEDPAGVPEGCRSVLEVRADGSATLTEPRTGLLVDGLIALGLPEAATAAALRGLDQHHRPAAGRSGRLFETAGGHP